MKKVSLYTSIALLVFSLTLGIWSYLKADNVTGFSVILGEDRSGQFGAGPVFKYIQAVNAAGTLGGTIPTTTDTLATTSMVLDSVNGFLSLLNPRSDGFTIGTAIGGGGLGAAPAAGILLRNVGPGGSGGTWDRNRAASAEMLTATLSSGIQLTTPHSTWSVTSEPAANTRATATRAAGAVGVRHVSTAISACYGDFGTGLGGAVTEYRVRLRDGASGAGTILWSGYTIVSGIAGDSKCIGPLPISSIGTGATAMTLEYEAAPGALNFQTVTLTGYSVN